MNGRWRINKPSIRVIVEIQTSSDSRNFNKEKKMTAGNDIEKLREGHQRDFYHCF
jgi:hypothetical protein